MALNFISGVVECFELFNIPESPSVAAAPGAPLAGDIVIALLGSRGTLTAEPSATIGGEAMTLASSTSLGARAVFLHTMSAGGIADLVLTLPDVTARRGVVAVSIWRPTAGETVTFDADSGFTGALGNTPEDQTVTGFGDAGADLTVYSISRAVSNLSPTTAFSDPSGLTLMDGDTESSGVSRARAAMWYVAGPGTSDKTTNFSSVPTGANISVGDSCCASFIVAAAEAPVSPDMFTSYERRRARARGLPYFVGTDLLRGIEDD